ncbi:unnamed protein product, partial [Brassica rapa subsp. trilocularis]
AHLLPFSTDFFEAPPHSSSSSITDSSSSLTTDSVSRNLAS